MSLSTMGIRCLPLRKRIILFSNVVRLTKITSGSKNYCTMDKSVNPNSSSPPSTANDDVNSLKQEPNSSPTSAELGPGSPSESSSDSSNSSKSGSIGTPDSPSPVMSPLSLKSWPSFGELQSIESGGNPKSGLTDSSDNTKPGHSNNINSLEPEISGHTCNDLGSLKPAHGDGSINPNPHSPKPGPSRSLDNSSSESRDDSSDDSSDDSGSAKSEQGNNSDCSRAGPSGTSTVVKLDTPIRHSTRVPGIRKGKPDSFFAWAIKPDMISSRNRLPKVRRTIKRRKSAFKDWDPLSHFYEVLSPKLTKTMSDVSGILRRERTGRRRKQKMRQGILSAIEATFHTLEKTVDILQE